MTITLTRSEDRALNGLRGLPEGAHMLVMCSRRAGTGVILEGSAEDFEELVAFIGDQLADGLVSPTAERALVSLSVKIDPDCGDWLGE